MNWQAMAEAVGLDLPPADLERLTAPLDAVDNVLRPHLRDLPPDLEPALDFFAEEEQSE